MSNIFFADHTHPRHGNLPQTSDQGVHPSQTLDQGVHPCQTSDQGVHPRQTSDPGVHPRQTSDPGVHPHQISDQDAENRPLMSATDWKLAQASRQEDYCYCLCLNWFKSILCCWNEPNSEK